MTISFPRTDIMTAVKFEDQTFRIVQRQELSRQSNGIVRGKDFGSGLWTASYTTVKMPFDDALAFEAMLDSLDGVIQVFEASDLRRLMPKMYPTGAGANNGTLTSVTNSKTMVLSGLVAGQVVSVGDYLSFDYGSNRALHRAVEPVTADGSGVTPGFEVRPYVRAGYSISSAVTLKTPRGRFSLLPGSVDSKLAGMLHSVVSFQAVQYLV